MSAVIAWLTARLAEPSTHAALAAVIAALTPLIPQPYGMIASAIFAALGFTMKEKV